MVASRTDLVEFNSSVILSCSSSGSSLSYHWLNGSSEVTAGEGVQLGDGGSTLTIVNVTRYDQGPFRCNMSNAVSHDISQLLSLTVAFPYYEPGSNHTLTCSAESRPPAAFTWVLNGTQESHQGPVLSLDNIQPWQSGSYSCVAYNNLTRNQKVSNGAIHPKDPEIIEGDSTNLTCDAAGSISTREWRKDGQPLSPNDRISFSEENRTLLISHVHRTDKGQYQYPVSVRPSTAFPIPMLGQDFSLTCQGSHRGLPVAWFKDGQTVSPDGEMIRLQEHNTTLHFNSLLPSDGGFYQCEAALDDSDVMSQGYLLDCE
ncbi:cell adhesion molecule CEACAM1-like [Aplochiton taeniatus]